MTIIQTSLYSTILDSLGLDPSSPSLSEVATTVIRHILTIDDAYDCQRQLKNSVDFKLIKPVSAQGFRLSLTNTSYVHLNLKYFAYNLLFRGTSKTNLIKFKKQFEIYPADVVLIKDIFTPKFRKMAQNKIKKREVDKKLYSKVEFDKVFTLFEKIYPELFKHIRKKTYKKLRFISVSSNIELYDLHMELVHKVLKAYIKMVPTTRSEIHIKNSLRSTINNYVVNMIRFNTAQKRRRMEQGRADGFGGYKYEIGVLSENQLFSAFGVDEDVPSYESMGLEDLNNSEQRMRESDIAYVSIMKRFGFTKRRRAFIKLIAGLEHSKFTSYLRKCKLITGTQDNVDYCNKVDMEIYFTDVCAFLKVQEDQAKRFMEQIGELAYPGYVKKTRIITYDSECAQETV